MLVAEEQEMAPSTCNLLYIYSMYTVECNFIAKSKNLPCISMCTQGTKYTGVLKKIWVIIVI